MTCPDPKETYTTPDGVVIPLGPGTNSNCGYSSLLYNEYPLLKKTAKEVEIYHFSLFHSGYCYAGTLALCGISSGSALFSVLKTIFRDRNASF